MGLSQLMKAGAESRSRNVSLRDHIGPPGFH
jgi:hypothetical protein